jgi:hypothetical protein
MSARSQGPIGRALARGAQWRYLVLFIVVMLVPTAIAMAPIHGFLKSLFDRSPRADALIAWLDSSAFLEVVRQSSEPAGAGIGPSLFGVALVGALLAPMLAGAAVALARKSGPTELRSLLGDAAALYPQMVRMAFASIIPLAIAGGGAAAAFHFADQYSARSVLEASASNAMSLARFASILLFWLANATIEAGRAHFAAAPELRSALLAWWSGVRLTIRHPAQVLTLCLVTTILGVGTAAVVTGIRLRITQGGTGSIFFAFILAQVAVAALAWGRSSKLIGLAELIRTQNKV